MVEAQGGVRKVGWRRSLPYGDVHPRMVPARGSRSSSAGLDALRDALMSAGVSGYRATSFVAVAAEVGLCLIGSVFERAVMRYLRLAAFRAMVRIAAAAASVLPASAFSPRAEAAASREGS